MANIFSSIPRPKLKRNTFNLSHEVKLTTEIGRLTPILCEPVVPGDSWKVKTEMLIRVAPLLAPVMHRVNIYTHFFFVPMRLIWKDWERFITGGESGTEEPAYPKLLINSGNLAANSAYVEKSSLLDYLDFPTCDFDDTSRSFVGDGDTMIIDALPFRAYQLIYNEYYRDQNLEAPINITRDVNGLLTDGETVRNLLTVRYRKWEKDYFTSALPWTQRGSETTIGLSGNADVMLKDNPDLMSNLPKYQNPATGANSSDGDAQFTIKAGRTVLTDDDGSTAVYNPNGSLYADLSTVNATTINELRRAINLQAYKEVLARSGSRYIEVIRGLFGVVSSDARLQRPEFLGGGKTPLMFGEVLQTSETTENSMLANFAGRAAAAGTTHKFKKFFEEHGLIIGIMSVMPKPAYMQGLPRKWYKFDRLDHYIPQFANIGEQAILNQELKYMFGNDADTQTTDNQDTFGYTPRYAEYKYIPSRVHGLFKTNLRFWHMARKFGEPSSDAPNLNKNFVTCYPSEVDRVFAVYSDDENPWSEHLWCQLYHNIKATRPMPKFGVPLI